MRLIDADALTKDLTYDFTGHPLHGNLKTTMGNIRAIILAQPTIDAVPVVRCRECIYCTWQGDELVYCDNFERDMMPDDYCSIGERKEATNVN